MEEIVLYVAKDKSDKNSYCRGSAMCLKIAEVLPSGTINIQDCDMLRVKNIKFPPWLDGTPIIVVKETGDIYKGSIALKYLREVLEDYSSSRKQTKNEFVENKKNGGEKKQFEGDVEGQFGGDNEEEEEDASYDAWSGGFQDVNPEEYESKSKNNQQDVEEFMRKRQSSLSVPDMNGNIPSISQEPS